MTDKEKKNKIAGILLDFYDEHHSNEINRPTIPNIYAGKILDSLQEEPVSEDFEEALAKEWQSYIDRGAATVDALEDNTQELAFAKGFYRGAQWQKKILISKACEWLEEHDTRNYEVLDDFSRIYVVDNQKMIGDFRKALEED